MDDWVYRKVSPMSGVMRFGKKGKLSPRYMRPYEVLKRIGSVAYELKLPIELPLVHPIFHVPVLKKCIGNLMSILPLEGLEVDTYICHYYFIYVNFSGKFETFCFLTCLLNILLHT